jgi:hypothetical protein
MSTTSTTQAEIIDQSEPVQALLNNPPKVPPTFTALLNWIIQLGFALVGLIANLTQPIMDQQEELAESARQANVRSIPTSSAAATAGHSRTSRRTNASPKRCNRCHASGHTVEDCKTTNPSAMRKRVARNNRIAKQARRTQAQPPPSVPPPFPWLPHHYPPPYPSPAPTYHMASLATDAAELRRRTAQSARDKRRHRRPSQPS